MVKQGIRQKLRHVLGRLTPQQRQAKSQAACERLCGMTEFQNARTVMLFLSVDHELDTTPAVRQALAVSKTVLVPHVVWEERRLIPVVLASLEEEMSTTPLGLRWPNNGQPISSSQIDLVIVPGLGFDRQGNRLGRGGGFYDRFLSENGFSGAVCGLGYEEQILDDIPAFDHDVPLDMLITDHALRRFR